MKDFLNFKSKTILFSYLLTGLSAAQLYLPELRGVLSENFGIVTLVIGVSVAILRKVTTKPLSEK